MGNSKNMQWNIDTLLVIIIKDLLMNQITEVNNP